MSKEAQIVKEEIKTKVAKRVPPGDRWSPFDNSTLILESLTDVLNTFIKKKVKHNFIWMPEKGLYILWIPKRLLLNQNQKRNGVYMGRNSYFLFN